jgi:hypothetical protein
MPTLKRFRITIGDLCFAASVIAFLFIFRFYPVSEELGRFVQGVFS